MDRTVTGPLSAQLDDADDVDHAQSSGEKSARAMFSVPEMVCGMCVLRIEDALTGLDGVTAARASLSQRRVTVDFRKDDLDIPQLLDALQNSGFSASELRDGAGPGQAELSSTLLPRVGVAGFAAANVMLLSVSVWSGSVSDMDAPVRTMFHWLSALIALPAIAYAGQPFYRSALSALKARRLNMDVPISLGVILATLMSVLQTMRGTEQVYFDAAITLLFFLLIGRLLDEQVRKRARGAAENLIGLCPSLATVVDADGKTSSCSVHDLQPGMRILVKAGERLAADGYIVSGESEIDESIITGETTPRYKGTSDLVFAGTLNGPAAIEIIVTATKDDALIGQVSEMMSAAEQSRGRYVRLADRAARIYAPAVHTLSLLTFIGWMIAGSNWEAALTTAVAVLIITCPCALALAVPVVQIAATSRLFKRGVIVKAADGLERLSEINVIVMDKTGTLTRGTLELSNHQQISDDSLSQAASLAVASHHPYAKAIVNAARERELTVARLENVQEFPGKGLLARGDEGEIRLGSARWLEVDLEDDYSQSPLWLRVGGQKPVSFSFVDSLRDDARETIMEISKGGIPIELVSGDSKSSVRKAAQEAGIEIWRGAVKPQDKIARIKELESEGRKVLMVGDGLNDAPALAAAHASLSPASAVDISQAAADAVFQGDALSPVVETIKVARSAQKLALQNLSLALAYNLFFVPLAVSGHVTPLVAAIAMSTSSILVTLNATRLSVMRLKPLREQTAKRSYQLRSLKFEKEAYS